MKTEKKHIGEKLVVNKLNKKKQENEAAAKRHAKNVVT